MIVIEVQDNFAYIETYEILKPEVLILKGSSLSTYILESNGEIFQVYEIHLGTSDIAQKFSVFKLDLSKMAWTQVESLGDRIFLLGDTSYSGSVISTAKFGAKGNCIYFFSKRRTELYCFDMEDGTITITQPCPTTFRQKGGLFWVISFSSPPTSSDCVVFGLKLAANKYVYLSAYHKVQNHWSSLLLTGLQYTFEASHCNPVFYNGVFYCLSKDGKLGVFNPNETTSEDMWRVYASLSVQDVSSTSSVSILRYSTRSFIIESNGDIFSVFVGLVGIPVCVYKLDQSNNMKWIKVTSLGDRVMFLSHTTSLLIPAVLNGTENKVYFPRFMKNTSVLYSLRSGKYHSFGDQISRENWIDTCEHWNCTWFQATN
ncbi:hypothetical protein ACHQM5_011491 [Ranunculus cassubicifolius]